MQEFANTELAALGHATDIRVIGGAGRNGQHAGTRGGDLILRGGGGGLGGGSGTGEDENDNEGANDRFHGSDPLFLL
jgi:hypothetical protein